MHCNGVIADSFSRRLELAFEACTRFQHQHGFRFARRFLRERAR